MAKRMDDDSVVSVCEAEISAASGWSSGELSNERARAMDYYLGEPYGDEREGRSQIRTREVLDTVESIMPSLVRIFADADNLVEFEAVGPEDEDAAQQESDRVSYEYWKQNKGFFNTYTFLKDCLLSKTGILKVWWDDKPEEEREEYNGLDDIELGQLIEDDTVDREILEFDQDETGYSIVFKTTRKRGQVRIEPVTPEEFGVNRDSRSPYAQDCQFVYQRNRKSRSELIEMGYSAKLLDTLPSNDDVETEERLARRHLDDESDILRFGTHKSSRMYWITECYLYLDRDGDEIAELLKVTLAAGAHSGGSGARLLDIEEVDEIPFFTASPIPITHKFYGLSMADLVMDLQLIKSTLVRQMLDNTYLANNQRTHVNENVNLDDLLTRRPGDVVRHAGDTQPQANMAPEPYSPLPQETFGLLEYMDELRKDRTGTGDDVPGLDAKSLANVNTGVAALAYDQSRARIELIARVVAEVAFRPMFKYIHELLLKHSQKAEAIKLRGHWVEVNPSEWRKRQNMTVTIGLGIATRERRLTALEAIGGKQAALIQAGGMGQMLMPDHIYNVHHDFAESLGLEPGRYFLDPREAQPAQPEGPSIQDQALMMSAQAQLGQAKSMLERSQVEAQKVQSAERIRMAELQASMRELQMKRELEVLKQDLQQLRSESDGASVAAKAQIEAQIKSREMDLKTAQMRMNDARERDSQQIEMYKAMLASSTTLTKEQMQVAGVPVQEAAPAASDAAAELLDEMRRELGNMRAQLQERDEADRAPRIIERDGKNGLIVSVGGRRVVRDESGRAVSVG